MMGIALYKKASVHAMTHPSSVPRRVSSSRTSSFRLLLVRPSFNLSFLPVCLWRFPCTATARSHRIFDVQPGGYDMNCQKGRRDSRVQMFKESESAGGHHATCFAMRAMVTI